MRGSKNEAAAELAWEGTLAFLKKI
jgi:hypothetical protein